MVSPPSREEQIFTAALQLKTEEERAAYITRECDGDAELLQRVEALVHAHEQALVLLSQDTYPKLIPILGQNLGAALNDRTVRVTGRLGTYGGFRAEWKERLQITLDDPRPSSCLLPPAQ